MNLKNLNNLTKDKVDYFQKRVDLYFDENSSNYNLVKKRILGLVAILYGLISSLILYVVSKYDFQKGFLEQEKITIFCMTLSLLYLVISVALFIKGYLSERYDYNGNEPKNFLKDEVCSLKLERIIASDLKNTQERLDKNKQRLKNKTMWINCCVIAMIISPFVSLISLVIFFF